MTDGPAATPKVVDDPQTGRSVLLDLGDGPEPFFALCWEERQDHTACDRMKYHRGRHSWES